MIKLYDASETRFPCSHWQGKTERWCKEMTIFGTARIFTCTLEKAKKGRRVKKYGFILRMNKDERTTSAWQETYPGLCVCSKSLARMRKRWRWPRQEWWFVRHCDDKFQSDMHPVLRLEENHQNRDIAVGRNSTRTGCFSSTDIHGSDISLLLVMTLTSVMHQNQAKELRFCLQWLIWSCSDRFSRILGV